MTASQKDFIYKYNDSTRAKFNPKLFERDENLIIEELKKIILSCQRNQKFTIKVESFEVIEDYAEILDNLSKYEGNLIKNSKKKKINQYEFISLKDSDFKLLKVNYFINVKEESERFTTLILTPKIVEKFYFRISGNMYHAMFQIVNGSTFNSELTSSNTPSITFRTTFNSKIKVFKKSYNMTTVDNESLNLTYYNVNISNRYFDVFKYILAKYGLIGTFRESKIPYINFSKTEVNDNEHYCFEINKNLFMYVPKVILDGDYTVQSLVCTLYRSLIFDPKYTIDEIFENDFWVIALSNEFKKNNINKGLATLESLESLYDIPTKESLRLREEIKCDIYHVLLWIIREFSELRYNKSNLDLATKKIRFEEYIASIYSMKLIKGIYRLTDIRNGINLKDIKRVLSVRPTYLLENISRCRLVKYRELVNDLDSMVALKCTNKNISSTEQKSIATIYRYIYPSDLGRMDIDSSPKSDPGFSGSFCPTLELDGKYFSKDYKEPDFWENEFNKLMNNYRATVGIKEALIFRRDILNDSTVTDDIEYVSENIEIMKALIEPVKRTEENAVYTKAFVKVDKEGLLIYG